MGIVAALPTVGLPGGTRKRFRVERIIWDGTEASGPGVVLPSAVHVWSIDAIDEVRAALLNVYGINPRGFQYVEDPPTDDTPIEV